MSDWDNKKEISLRTRIALKLLLMAIKVVEPYQFGHQFEADYKDLNAMIDGDKKAGKNDK